jgi:hypothetical protein
MDGVRRNSGTQVACRWLAFAKAGAVQEDRQTEKPLSDDVIQIILHRKLGD